MIDDLQNSIIKLRATLLIRRVKLLGHEITLPDAEDLVVAFTDKVAYIEAVNTAHRRQSFWHRFWW